MLRQVVVAAVGLLSAGCGPAPDAAQGAGSVPRSDTGVVLRLTLEDPAAGVGVVEVRGDGRAVFFRTGIGERREARLGTGEVAALLSALGPDLCAIPGDSGTGLANRLRVEARWSELACTVRRSEAAWRSEPRSRSVRDALDGLERRICGGPCGLDPVR